MGVGVQTYTELSQRLHDGVLRAQIRFDINKGYISVK